MEDINIDWINYTNKINNTLTGMWNFILYDKFCDEKVIELKKELNKMRMERDNLIDENLDLKIASPKPIEKKRKRDDLLKDEFKKVKRFKSSTKDAINIMAIEIYKNLNTIEDIIELKNHPRKFDFVANDKFNKLYNIIPALEELNNIIGMKNVKDKIFRSICYFLHNTKSVGLYNENEMNHIMIMGPPGVGKTTIARIMGTIYLSLGFLSNDTFITAKRSDLIGKYLGHTADKTQKVIDSAMGGVLFIDEVYSLGNKEQRDSFAKECIDTINLNMSRTDKPWLLIVGGYKEDIHNSFLSYNQGLERRFTVKLEINNYTEKELFGIIMSFIKKENWMIEENAITEEFLKKHLSRFKYYGGDMRKLFQLAKENFSVRMMKQSITLNNMELKLSKDDFIKSMEQFPVAKEENTSHLMMYI